MDVDSTPVRILHLDDDKAMAWLLKSFLQGADRELRFSIELVSNKEAYLKALGSHNFDLILSDFAMPGYDGYEALRDAKAICPDVPFIMVTGELGEERAIETLKLGATDYVLKDRLQRLVPSIKRALKDAAAERESRETAKNLVEAQRIAHIGNWEWNIQTGHVRWSAELYAIYRLDPATFVPTMDSFAQYVHPDDREFLNRQTSQLLATGNRASFDFRIIAADGSTRVLHTICEVRERDDAGKPLLIAGTNQDITERKQVEEALRLSEEKYAIAFANNPAVISLTRLKDGVYLEVNDTWVAMTGYKREEAIGRSAREMPIWPTLDDTIRFVQEISKQGFVRGREQEFRKKSGEPFIVQMSSQILTIQGEEVILSTMVDVTEHKRMEAALRASEENLRLMVNEASDAMMVLDADGIIQAVSHLGARLLGYEEGELIGKHAKELAETFSRLEVALKLNDLRTHAPGPVTTSVQIRTKAGTIHLLSLEVRSVALGTKAEKYFIKFTSVDLPSGPGSG